MRWSLLASFWLFLICLTVAGIGGDYTDQKIILEIEGKFLRAFLSPHMGRDWLNLRKMTTEKKLGIWMDHSSAHLMEFTSDPIETTIIVSKFTHEDKEQSLRAKGESLMHKKEQHRQSDYYAKLAEAIKKYDDVILFGPTDAKAELFNLLREDHLFAKIRIETRQTDKMTENQQHAFVKEYFASSG